MMTSGGQLGGLDGDGEEEMFRSELDDKVAGISIIIDSFFIDFCLYTLNLKVVHFCCTSAVSVQSAFFVFSSKIVSFLISSLLIKNNFEMYLN